VTAGGIIDRLYLSIPKAAQVVAGKDIVDLTYFGQNLNATRPDAALCRSRFRLLEWLQRL